MIGPKQIRHVSLPREGAPLVVLLGGIGPNPHVPGRMGRALYAAGYAVEAIHYPSTRHPIRELVSEHVGPALAKVNTAPARPLHFVTFSMGGIILRELLRAAPPENFSRAVQVAPPNNGSEVAQFLLNWKFYRWMFGPAGGQLGQGDESYPKQLGPLPPGVGVIAGTRSFDPWFSWMFKGPHDGKVAIASAQQDGMADFVTVPADHYLILGHRDTIRHTLNFLREGKF
ncbi:alpha/beta hydrolase [Ruficoccus amylovorans]|uniref:Alpha/beta hydrolase n=1 Tax=Ruficoccus amylovorans TaxID=1804625 RepID=A0A842HHQ1_9BACT|nr:alpha/beta hydrolase [Ruficoccus amylovorans]MBC2595136.1 alpha/beta hydrolase [Ruficoccus amylovorans]